MTKKTLKNKPLVEAIFELRWELQDKEGTPGMKVDPHYKILIGRIYDRVVDKYPFHEELPTATIPDEISEYVVQHRFRKDKDKWPLIQIGPGIITLNDTEEYDWDDFENRITHLIDTLFEIYPDAKSNLKVKGMLLRYINAINFDYTKDNVFDFLKEKMKMNVKIHEKLFEHTEVGKVPLGFDLRFSFPATKPKGSVNLRFYRGKRNETESLMWETMVRTPKEECPKLREAIDTWIKGSHKLTDDWFYKIIEGDLAKRFE